MEDSEIIEELSVLIKLYRYKVTHPAKIDGEIERMRLEDGKTDSEIVEELRKLIKNGWSEDLFDEGNNASWIDYKIERLKYFGMDGNIHRKTEPIFSLVSVQLHITKHLDDDDDDDGKPSRIYGFILVKDQLDDANVYLLYCKKMSDSQELELHNHLSLAGYPFSPHTPIRVFIYLRDAARDLQIADGYFDLNYTGHLDYDVCKQEKVYGDNNGYALVRHNTFKGAFVATVKVRVGKRRAYKGDVVEVFGRISAHFDGNYKKKMTQGKDEYILFERIIDKPASFVAGEKLELSRSKVAVPAYSMLIIMIELWDRDGDHKIVEKQVELSPGEKGTDDLQFRDEDYVVLLDVEWEHPGELVKFDVNKLSYGCIDQYEERRTTKSDLLEVLNMAIKDETSKCRILEQMARNMLTGCDTTSRNLNIYRSLPSTKGSSLLEVFSVMVGSFDKDCFNICGKIRVLDVLGSSFIYMRNDNPEFLGGGYKVLSTVGSRRSFLLKDFRLDVELCEGDDKGKVLSKGFMKWDAAWGTSYLSWYDRRICSIIRGDYGYAAIHYTIFSSGVEAVMKMLYFADSGVDSCMCGRIVAGYNNYNYVTYSDKLYQNVLFKELLDHVVLSSGSEIPLLKKVIAAPSDCSLVVHFDLKTWCNEHINSTSVALRGKLEFPASCTEWQKITAENGDYIKIKVEWRLLGGF